MTEPTFTVHKWGATIPVSVEMLLAAGAITEEQARAQGWTPFEPVKIPWRTRFAVALAVMA